MMPGSAIKPFTTLAALRAGNRRGFPHGLSGRFTD
jgi:hypothetical protein